MSIATGDYDKFSKSMPPKDAAIMVIEDPHKKNYNDSDSFGKEPKDVANLSDLPYADSEQSSIN